MARALVLLACAAAAAASHYVEYAGGKMPQYGGDYEAVDEPAPALAPHLDDYHGHSPDAPASLDYKYREEQRSQTDRPSKNVDDADVWRKVRRKQRGVQRTEARADLDSLGDDEYDEQVPRVRSGRGHVKRRPRLKGADDADPSVHTRSAKYSRDKKIVSDSRDLDRDDFSDVKSQACEDDVGYVARDTTRRVRRRKPRDRTTKSDDDLNADEEVLVADRRMKGDEEKDPEYPAVGAEAGRRRPPAERYRPVLDDDDAADIRASKRRQKIYDDYNDYYDMKRVQSIKQKLPALLRRSTTVKAPTKTPRETELAYKLWANRRLGAQPAASGPRAGPDSESDSGEIVDIVTSDVPTAAGGTARRAPTATALAKTSSLSLTSAKAFAMANTSRELSLAEKSRLSILKKAQRKDGVKDESTKKPPVLLQVTQKLATVVMVEPPSSRQPWLPPHVLTGDSPERIERVKKLMRHKLVAQARSIQDLTDNWDEMVCDYIDVALLDSGAPAPVSLAAFVTTISIVLLSFCVPQLDHYTTI